MFVLPILWMYTTTTSPPGSSTLPLSLKPKVPFFQIWTFWLPRSSTHLNSRSQGLLDFCSVRPRRVAHATPDNGKRFPSDTEFRHARVPHSLLSSHSTPPTPLLPLLSFPSLF